MRTLCLKALEGVRTVRNGVLNRIDPPVVCLLYHRVAELDVDSQQLAVSPENFRAQLRFLREKFPVVPLDADWSRTTAPAVAISFDDGYADNLLNALPIVEEVGVPVTFFVTTGHVGTHREFWWDELERLLMVEGRGSGRISLRVKDGEKSWPVESEPERATVFAELQQMMRSVDENQRGQWFDRLREWAGVSDEGRPTHRALSVAELQELASSAWVEIGAHTVTHSPLSALDESAQLQEISRSREQLELWLNRPVRIFAYPFGGPRDFTDRTVRLVRQSGFERAYVNYPGQVHRWSDPYRLRRHLVRDWPVDLFAEQLRRFWTYSA